MNRKTASGRPFGRRDLVRSASQNKIIEEIEALVNEVPSNDQPQLRPLTPDPSPPKKRGRGEPDSIM